MRRLIVDSLRHCVDTLGIDGFRFDLAAALARTAAGFDTEHPLFAEIRAEPGLAGVKLIAEPWDVGPGGYRLGTFPRDWAEWNDQFRDTVRRFWCAEPGRAPDFARRVHGSADIFEPGGRAPPASINFITSHDGFTLADLVSFVERHNEANGEHNQDGHRHNFSVNHGVEGPTGDAAINTMRRRHRINLLATLFFSQGTPMLLAGDEFGNSQAGNNNAYAQDNETGWLDWEGLKQDQAFFDEVCRLAALRRELPLLRQAVYRHGDPAAATGHPDIEWFDAEGLTIRAEEWPAIGALGILLSHPDEADRTADGVNAVAILYSVLERDIPFRLPLMEPRGSWRWRFSSAGQGSALTADGGLDLAGFSVACLTHES